jgi:hypothetical protein
MSFAICASSRIASSVRCIISLDDGRSGFSSASIALGATGTEGIALIAVSSSLACRCSSSTFCVATVISFCALSFGNTGSGDFARRFLSVLPPPSRFACASTSALVGFSLVLALTSATSIGCARPRSLITIGAKRIVSTTAWIASEMPSAHITSRSLRPPASASGGMRAGGSAPAGAIFAVRVPWASAAGSRSNCG